MARPLSADALAVIAAGARYTTQLTITKPDTPAIVDVDAEPTEPPATVVNISDGWSVTETYAISGSRLGVAALRLLPTDGVDNLFELAGYPGAKYQLKVGILLGATIETVTVFTGYAAEGSSRRLILGVGASLKDGWPRDDRTALVEEYTAQVGAARAITILDLLTPTLTEVDTVVEDMGGYLTSEGVYNGSRSQAAADIANDGLLQVGFNGDGELVIKKQPDYAAADLTPDWQFLSGTNRDRSIFVPPLSRTDSFERDDSATDLGATLQGTPWQQAAGVWGIDNGRAYCPTPEVEYAGANVETAMSDCIVEATISTFPATGYAGLWLRADATLGSGFFVQNNSMWLVDGVTQVGPNFTANFVDGDRMRAVLRGETITIYRQVGGVGAWAQVMTTTSSLFLTNTRHGINTYGVTGDDSRFDDFSVVPFTLEPIVAEAPATIVDGTLERARPWDEVLVNTVIVKPGGTDQACWKAQTASLADTADPRHESHIGLRAIEIVSDTISNEADAAALAQSTLTQKLRRTDERVTLQVLLNPAVEVNDVMWVAALPTLDDDGWNNTYIVTSVTHAPSLGTTTVQGITTTGYDITLS